MISAYLLGAHEGDARPRAAAARSRPALQYALGQQIRPDNDFDVVGDADGGMPGSPIDRSVRIDYVQHVCSAMIRASEWPELAGEPGGAPAGEGAGAPAGEGATGGPR